jgi:hypothetical protein
MQHDDWGFVGFFLHNFPPNIFLVGILKGEQQPTPF